MGPFIMTLVHMYSITHVTCILFLTQIAQLMITHVTCILFLTQIAQLMSPNEHIILLSMTFTSFRHVYPGTSVTGFYVLRCRLDTASLCHQDSEFATAYGAS